MTTYIFRVVGGKAHRKSLEAYEIIPYELIKETERYYYVLFEGRKQLQNKRVTGNSRWCVSLEDALGYLIDKIETEIHVMHDSWTGIREPNTLLSTRLYFGRFERGKFSVEHFDVLSTTSGGTYRGKPCAGAWRIRAEKTRTKTVKMKGRDVQREVSYGRTYIYAHVSQPHNPDRPYEKWIGTSFSQVYSLMELYMQSRQKYLEKAKEDARSWVVDFEGGKR